MKKITLWLCFLAGAAASQSKRPAYRDVPYTQDYAVRFYTSELPAAAACDRNGVTEVLASGKILHPAGGRFQYPGTLEPKAAYVPMKDRRPVSVFAHDGQLVYLDSQAVFTNAWAGTVFLRHGLPGAKMACGGDGKSFLVSDGKALRFLQNGAVAWRGELTADIVKSLCYDPLRRRFLILGDHSVSAFSPADGTIRTVFQRPDLTCFAISGDKLCLGTRAGYLLLHAATFRQEGMAQKKLPVPELSAVAFIREELWFGSAMGAFRLRADGKYDYYFGERWLPGNRVLQLFAGEGATVSILTDKGLGEIRFDRMTLEDKALAYEKQVRQRHIRYGFNCDVSRLKKNGDLSTFEMGQRDSDNLWTSMYLISQLFRYKVTKDPEALQNFRESFDAMDRLFTITGMPGYFARGFERRGYHKFSNQPWDGGMTNGWVHASDEGWDWRGTTSSDQTVGQMFTLTLVAQLMDGELKQRAIRRMDELMTAIIEHDWYLIDFDGKPTLWGKWNPEYVNGFPKNVGDRKLYSSNIIGFLQAAYHFTGKKLYREKAYELMQKHGYLENLLRPIREIGQAPADADQHAKDMSESWNHSDDEMYFLAYWCLYPYAFDAGLKKQYLAAIRDHWQAEKPEKNGLWNLCYAMTGASDFGLDETVWYLKEFPLDMIEWQVLNSHRKDLEFIPDNFRGQTTREVLPPDERPELKHNRNLFKLDRRENGISELSAGDSFLLPYWMGRYLGVISAPVR
jgi:hypothetical protein